jgi:hypothetical protein
MLDLWRRDEEVAARPQSGEGINLPSWFDLHHTEITWFLSFLALALLALALIYFRSRVFSAFIAALVLFVRSYRLLVHCGEVIRQSVSATLRE